MISPITEVGQFVRAALLEPVARTAPAPSRRELLRRRIAAAVTIVLGAVLLALTLHADTASSEFFVLGFALAALWGIGAFVSGPLRLGTAHTRNGGRSRAVVQSLVLAGALISLFLVGALLVAQLPGLREPVLELLEHGSDGPLALVVLLTAVNGVAEELFFRGALYSAIGGGWIAVGLTTMLYTLTTVGSGVGLLVLAAALLGLITALQRRVTGGVLAPIVTHVTWSVSMLLLLPTVLDFAR